MESFAGQLALVTGASSGIGRAIARELAQRGARIWAVGRRLAALNAALDAAGDARVRCFETDLASDDGLGELGRALDATDALDLLVHCAGILYLGRFDALTARQFDEQYRVNLRAPLEITQRALPALRRQQGQVVFVNSTAGLKAAADAVQYSATKFGLRALADGLRDQVNPEGIRVLSVFAGRTATPMQAAIHANEGRTWAPEKLLRPEDVAASVLGALTLPRTAEVYEISVRPMARLGA